MCQGWLQGKPVGRHSCAKKILKGGRRLVRTGAEYRRRPSPRPALPSPLCRDKPTQRWHPPVWQRQVLGVASIIQQLHAQPLRLAGHHQRQAFGAFLAVCRAGQLQPAQAQHGLPAGGGSWESEGVDGAGLASAKDARHVLAQGTGTALKRGHQQPAQPS